MQFKKWITAGLGLHYSVFVFFYSHLSLVILSLIPATFRFVQMWHESRTPIWMEGAVEGTRVVIFLLMIAFLEKTEITSLFKKDFWEKWNQQFTEHFERNWPRTIVPQIVAFIIVMYLLMNTLIEFFLSLGTVPGVMSLLGIEHYDSEVAYTAVLFFVKNMTIIPMSMVYILRLCGFGSSSDALR